MTSANSESQSSAAARYQEVHAPSSGVVRFPQSAPLKLACGIDLAPFQIAYQTYGTLNAAKSNAVLICHALTGDQHVANTHPVTGKDGWWESTVGPGKLIDTNRFFVICSNILGGCMGSTGPASNDPKTGKPYGLDFPVITIGDMVEAQARLIDHLGIPDLFAVIGGSMGGMQVLEWAASYPKDRVFSAVPIATAPRHSFGAEHRVPRGRPPGRSWPTPSGRAGDYRYAPDQDPGANGLAVARMTAHITYLSEAGPAAQVRPLPAEPRRAGDVLASMPISRSRATCATRARLVRRPLRRQLLSLHHPGDGLFRPRGLRMAGVLANAFKGTARRASA